MARKEPRKVKKAASRSLCRKDRVEVIRGLKIRTAYDLHLKMEGLEEEMRAGTISPAVAGHIIRSLAIRLRAVAVQVRLGTDGIFDQGPQLDGQRRLPA